MKIREEKKNAWGIESEEDDELENGSYRQRNTNLSPPNFESSVSVSYINSFVHTNSYNGSEGETNPNLQQTWPLSYRQSIDMLSSVPSPQVGFLSSSLIQTGNSFLRMSSSIFASETVPQTLTAPVNIPGRNIFQKESPFDPLLPPSTPPTESKAGSFIISSYCELPPSPQCSTTQAFINGINVLCGVGILSTPYAVKEGGWLSLLFLLAMGIISCYTGILLKKCLDISHDLETYPDIGQAAFGITGRIIISIILYLELYACCVEYITLVSDSLTAIFPNAQISFMGFSLTPQQIFAVTTALAVLPTVWLRNLSILSYLSAGGVIASLLVVTCLFWVGTVDGVGFKPGGTALDLTNLPVAFGLYGFCYSGHSVFPNIYSSMNQKSHFPLVLIFSFLLCTVLYGGVAAAGFTMFGEAIKSQFTLNMPHDFISSKIAIWTTVVNPLTKYALTMTPVALCLEELLPTRKQSYFIAVSIRTALVISTLVVSLCVPFFGFVMALLGSVFTMLVALILPCACFIGIHRKSANLFEVTLCILIIIVGVACAFIGSYSSILQMIYAKQD